MEDTKFPELSLGFSTHDDQLAWMTINVNLSLHAHLLKELIVIDDSPRNSKYAKDLEEYCVARSNCAVPIKYVRRIGQPSSCVYKNAVFTESTADYAMCIDSHVYLEPGSLDRLLAYIQSDEHHERDMIMGPCYAGTGRLRGTNQKLHDWEDYKTPKDAEISHGFVVRGGVLGAWVDDPRAHDVDGTPYEVQQHGTSCFCMRRDLWPGFPNDFFGHGGNETYLMETVRRRGGRVLVHPGVQQVHCFYRPQGTPYPLRWEPRVRNYLKSTQLLDDSDMYDACVEHLRTRAPRDVTRVSKEVTRPMDLYKTLLSKLGDPARLAGGAMPRPLFEQLRMHLATLPRGSRTLELGSGLSTLLFDHMKMEHTAIEHDESWAQRVRACQRNGSVVRHAPLLDGWYDWSPSEIVKYDVVLIDGPPGVGAAPCDRRECLRLPWETMLESNAAVFVDDTQRHNEQDLAEQLAKRLNRRVVRHSCGNRAYATLELRNH